MPDKDLRFTGRGFSKTEMTPEELAEQRERNKHYDEHFLSADDFVEAMGLGWLSKVAKGFPAFARAFLLIGALAGAYLAVTKTGFFL